MKLRGPFLFFNGNFNGEMATILNIMLENDLNMIDLALTQLNQPWGPPWTLATIGDMPLWTLSTTRYLGPSGVRSQPQVVILPGQPPPGHLVDQCVCLPSIQPLGPWDQPILCASGNVFCKGCQMNWIERKNTATRWQNLNTAPFKIRFNFNVVRCIWGKEWCLK